MLDDADHGAACAVSLQSSATESANRSKPIGSAGDVDLSGDAAAYPLGSFRRRDASDFGDFTHELMARYAAKTMIAAKNLNVGVTNAG
jgi:hypothetical protein